jgi:hypothetical protein
MNPISKMDLLNKIRFMDEQIKNKTAKLYERVSKDLIRADIHDTYIIADIKLYQKCYKHCLLKQTKYIVN